MTGVGRKAARGSHVNLSWHQPRPRARALLAPQVAQRDNLPPQKEAKASLPDSLCRADTGPTVIESDLLCCPLEAELGRLKTVRHAYENSVRLLSGSASLWRQHRE